VADCRPAINKTKSFTYLIRLEGPKCTPGGAAGYGGGAGGMAWEATAENWRRRRVASLGFGGLLLVRLLLVLRKL